MKILLVTISARGHAVAEALKRSRHNPDIIHVCPSRNPGIRKLASEQYIVSSVMDFPAIVEIARKTKPDFAFIAPDDPIGGGLVDILRDTVGIPSVAPTKRCAQIEASKSFARNLLHKHGVDISPAFRVFTAAGGAMRSFMEADLRGEYVVKYDGLLGGKGVKLSGEHLMTVEEGMEFARECLKSAPQVVIEEKLIGCEFSLMSFASGTQVVSMPAVQDHKRAFDGDNGPNTGGMGSFSDANHSLPFLRKADIELAHTYNIQTAKALKDELGVDFKGILYGGFIATAKGLRLIEYNARFGDPEVLNVLPLLQSDFVEICQAIISGELNKNIVQFEKKATVCKYITPECYPLNKECSGHVVRFPEAGEHSRIYFGDIAEDKDGVLHLGGSRTAGIVGIGDTLEEAEKIAQELCEKVEGPVRFRSDIGTKELIAKRKKMMQELRK